MSLTKTKNKRTIPLAFLNITEDHCLFLQLVIYLQTKKSILPYGSPEWYLYVIRHGCWPGAIPISEVGYQKEDRRISSSDDKNLNIALLYPMVIICVTYNGVLRHGYTVGHPWGYLHLWRRFHGNKKDVRNGSSVVCCGSKYECPRTNAFSYEKELQKTSVTCYPKDIRDMLSKRHLWRMFFGYTLFFKSVTSTETRVFNQRS